MHQIHTLKMRNLTAAFALLLLSFSACDKPAESSQPDLQGENRQLRARADSLEQQLAIARQENSRDSVRAASATMLDEADLAWLKSRGLNNPEDDLKRDLLQSRNILPQKGVLGGTMRFTEDGIRVLNRKWVLAYFEDGHNAGNALLTYRINNGKITWKVIHSELL